MQLLLLDDGQVEKSLFGGCHQFRTSRDGTVTLESRSFAAAVVVSCAV